MNRDLSSVHKSDDNFSERKLQAMGKDSIHVKALSRLGKAEVKSPIVDHMNFLSL